VVLQVLAGLDAASRAGFVHLGVEPGNLILDGDRVRLMDWGLSRRWRDEKEGPDATMTFIPTARAGCCHH
jgi:serine/threonine protein kinase